MSPRTLADPQPTSSSSSRDPDHSADSAQRHACGRGAAVGEQVRVQFLSFPHARFPLLINHIFSARPTINARAPYAQRAISCAFQSPPAGCLADYDTVCCFALLVYTTLHGAECDDAFLPCVRSLLQLLRIQTPLHCLRPLHPSPIPHLLAPPTSGRLHPADTLRRAISFSSHLPPPILPFPIYSMSPEAALASILFSLPSTSIINIGNASTVIEDCCPLGQCSNVFIRVYVSPSDAFILCPVSSVASELRG
ncbi:hypothetical protein FB451DRAFT_1414998 [Mycena latifolia]|nr:hypothetical protein FB451DRAFT_1414998 [Mycena latifolia]